MEFLHFEYPMKTGGCIWNARAHFKPDSNFREKFQILTLDIETFNNNGLGEFEPFAIGFYDGINFSSYHLTDYNSPDEMILSCLKAMLSEEYRGYTIYAHNFGGFDSLFIISTLAGFKNLRLDPLVKDNKIIYLSVYRGDDLQCIFLDSIKMLPDSLRSLAKIFEKSCFKETFQKMIAMSVKLEILKVKSRDRWS